MCGRKDFFVATLGRLLPFGANNQPRPVLPTQTRTSVLLSVCLAVGLPSRDDG